MAFDYKGFRSRHQFLKCRRCSRLCPKCIPCIGPLRVRNCRQQGSLKGGTHKQTIGERERERRSRSVRLAATQSVELSPPAPLHTAEGRAADGVTLKEAWEAMPRIVGHGGLNADGGGGGAACCCVCCVLFVGPLLLALASRGNGGFCGRWISCTGGKMYLLWTGASITERRVRVLSTVGTPLHARLVRRSRLAGAVRAPLSPVRLSLSGSRFSVWCGC